MTSETYRQTLADSLENYKLANFLQFGSLVDIQYLQRCLSNPAFANDATIDELYLFKKHMNLLSFRIDYIQKQISKRNLAMPGEFEDKAMELEDLGLETRVFDCVSTFNDPHSDLDILPGTRFIAVRLTYAITENSMVTGRYTNLNTNHHSKKLVDLFTNGQETILSLKILENHFTEVH
jgi:hypothetical protein